MRTYCSEGRRNSTVTLDVLVVIPHSTVSKEATCWEVALMALTLLVVWQCVAIFFNIRGAIPLIWLP